MISMQKIRQAQEILAPAIYKTDVMRASTLTETCDLWLKAENLQKTGSFKIRGAYFKMSQLTEEEKRRGVIACSAGNHAQGVALAATANGIRALICLPEGAPISKVEATRRYGAEICLVPGVYDDAYRRALELQREHGYTFVHPFNDEDVIAGQGTIGAEILDQLQGVDAVVVPVGGGGLISGVAFTIKQLDPRVKVYGVQAAGAPGMVHALHEHKLSALDRVSTIADGIAVKEPGSITFSMTEQYVDDVVTVTDDEISAAILALLEREKVVAEGAGAVSVAAVLSNKLPVDHKKVCCIVSGGNIDVTILNRVIRRGLVMSGRQYTLDLELPDRPGQLTAVTRILAACGANVTSVHHERGHAGWDVIGCSLRIEMETRDFAHINEIKQKLTEAGFRLL